MKHLKNRTSVKQQHRTALPIIVSTAVLLCFPSFVSATGIVPESSRPNAFAAFAVVIALTLVITWINSRRGGSASEFYTAVGGISGGKNGLAIAGDYLSAAAFLGVSGLVGLYGFDGIIYLVGFFTAFVPVLLLVAEPCRNLGRFTFGDVLSYRHDFRISKSLAALSSVIVAISYMVPQIVGGAVLLYALLGVPYQISVVVVGALMLVYVTFGGMRATTWVQIIKAVLLLSMCSLLTVLALAPFGFSVTALLEALAHRPELREWILTIGSSPVESKTLITQSFFEPGLYLKDPVELLSLGIALVLGTAAMPHIMMRFFSVKNAQTARRSVLWGMLWIGGCHLLIIVIGFAAAYYVGSAKIATADKGGNLAALLLAQHLGGGTASFWGNVLVGIVAAIAFATIVAVVAGLTLAAASSLAHDVYVGTIKGGVASEHEQLMAGKVASIFVAIVATSAALLAKGQNVAHLVGLAYAVAASANLPALLATLYWKHCNTRGVVFGVIGGVMTTIVFVLVSPNMQYPLTARAQATQALASANARLAKLDSVDASTAADRNEVARQRESALAALATAQSTLDSLGARTTSIVGLEKPLIPLRNPAIVSVPIGFLLLVIGSLFGHRRETDAAWQALIFRRDSGVGVAQAMDH